MRLSSLLLRPRPELPAYACSIKLRLRMSSDNRHGACRVLVDVWTVHRRGLPRLIVETVRREGIRSSKSGLKKMGLHQTCNPLSPILIYVDHDFCRLASTMDPQTCGGQQPFDDAMMPVLVSFACWVPKQTTTQVSMHAAHQQGGAGSS